MMNQWVLTAFATLVVMGPAVVHGAPLEVSIGFPDGGGLILQKEVQSLQELKHKNLIMQERDFSCGSASLATIFNYSLGRPIKETEIIRALLDLNIKKGTIEKVIERRGFTLLDLKLFAESHGFKATGFRLDFEDLANLGAPAIVPIIPQGFKHFVVFRGADEKRVYLADPSVGNITLSIEQFKKEWYGFVNVALVVAPPGDERGEGHALTLSELDKVFAGNESIDSFFNAGVPLRHFIPGEF